MYGVARWSSGDTLIAYREACRKPWQRGDGPIGFNISLAWTEGLGIVYIDHVASSSHSRSEAPVVLCGLYRHHSNLDVQALQQTVICVLAHGRSWPDMVDGFLLRYFFGQYLVFLPPWLSIQHNLFFPSHFLPGSIYYSSRNYAPIISLAFDPFPTTSPFARAFHCNGPGTSQQHHHHHHLTVFHSTSPCRPLTSSFLKMSCPLRAILNHGDEDHLSISDASQGLSSPPAASTKAPSTLPIATPSQQAEPTSHGQPAVKSNPSTGPALKYPDAAATQLSSAPENNPHKHSITSNNNDNNGIFNRLLNHPELMFEMVSHLDVDHLLALYSISRDFHGLANNRFTTMILSHARTRAPGSSYIFPFRCYRKLCLRDPALRRNETKPNFQIRHVPSFKWLKMVLFRERVVDGIVECLEEECLMLPAATTLTIKKIWFFMDVSTNERRDGLIRNTDYWSEKDIYLAHLFLMKLDMLFTCPMTGDGDLGLRKMLLAQRSLSTLLRVLPREEMRNTYELFEKVVAWKYEPNDLQRQLNQPIFGVAPNRVGMLQYEGWGRNPGTPFHQIDDLLIWESLRRGLDVPAHYLDMVFYGFIDKKTGLDIWTEDQKMKQAEEMERRIRGEDEEVLVAEEDDDDDDDDDYGDDDDGDDEDEVGDAPGSQST